MKLEDIKAKIKLSENVEFLIEEGLEKGITWDVLVGKKPILVAKKGSEMIAFYKGKMPLNSSGSAKISKNKNLTKKILAYAGIKTPKGFLINDAEKLELLMNSTALRYPLVVKPNDEALGQGVVADISDFGELRRVMKNILTDRKNVLVEEYFDGVDHRFLVLDGVVLAVAMRVKPQVIGDGVNTIKTLVNSYNEGRIRKVPFDGELSRYLGHQGYDINSVPQKGGKVILRGNSNYRTGGRSVDVTDTVAKGYKEIAGTAARVLGMRLAGVDILIKDNKKFGDYTVTEVNSVPGFDVHLQPDEGKKRVEILDKILDKLLGK